MNAHGEEQVSASFAGRFWAVLWGMDCVLELRLNSSGALEGSFEADGERLEVEGSSPTAGHEADCEFAGTIRASVLPEAFAAFKARLTPQGLCLELRSNPVGASPEPVTGVIFERLI